MDGHTYKRFSKPALSQATNKCLEQSRECDSETAVAGRGCEGQGCNEMQQCA